MYIVSSLPYLAFISKSQVCINVPETYLGFLVPPPHYNHNVHLNHTYNGTVLIMELYKIFMILYFAYLFPKQLKHLPPLLSSRLPPLFHPAPNCTPFFLPSFVVGGPRFCCPCTPTPFLVSPSTLILARAIFHSSLY